MKTELSRGAKSLRPGWRGATAEAARAAEASTSTQQNQKKKWPSLFAGGRNLCEESGRGQELSKVNSPRCQLPPSAFPYRKREDGRDKKGTVTSKAPDSTPNSLLADSLPSEAEARSSKSLDEKKGADDSSGQSDDDAPTDSSESAGDAPPTASEHPPSTLRDWQHALSTIVAPMVEADEGELYLAEPTTEAGAAKKIQLHLRGRFAGCPGNVLVQDQVIVPLLRAIDPGLEVEISSGALLPEGAERVPAQVLDSSDLPDEVR